MANGFKDRPSNINEQHDQSKNFAWHRFVNHLWTDKKHFWSLPISTIYSYLSTLMRVACYSIILILEKHLQLLKIKNGKVTKSITGNKIKKGLQVHTAVKFH
ncbi:MAG: hypothetical protein ACI8UG_001247 [Gammaproteobacteria bacterium]|jgi:hypothetical protein